MTEAELKFKQDIDFSMVDPNDRSYVRKIVYGVLDFDRPMPLLDTSIFPASDHYNVTFKGWTHDIDPEKYYETFVSVDRASLYDALISSRITPESDIGTIVVFKVRKSSFAKQKRFK